MLIYLSEKKGLGSGCNRDIVGMQVRATDIGMTEFARLSTFRAMTMYNTDQMFTWCESIATE